MVKSDYIRLSVVEKYAKTANKENKMKKGLLALSAATLFVMTTPVQAKRKFVYLIYWGKAGESYKLVEEWKLAQKHLAS